MIRPINTASITGDWLTQQLVQTRYTWLFNSILFNDIIFNSYNQITLRINEDLTTSLLVFGNISTIHANTIQSTEHLVCILKELADTTVCTGNYDTIFIKIISEKGGVLLNKTGKCVQHDVHVC